MRRGFSLVEILVSLSIFGIFVVLFTNFFQINRNIYENISMSNKAWMLASEGIEVVRFLSRADYSGLSLGDNGLEIQSGTWGFNGNSEILGEFERTISITEPAPDVRKIQSNVVYEVFGDQKEVNLFTYLTDWSRDLPVNVCIPQNNPLYLFTDSVSFSGGGTLLEDMYIENTAIDCNIIIDKIRVTWSPPNPKRQFINIFADDNLIWSGAANRNNTVDVSDILLEPGTSLSFSIEFGDDVSDRSFTVNFIMSDNANSNFSITVP